MNAYKLEVLVIDFDHIGEQGVKDAICNARYPNHCISPSVELIQAADIGVWTDDHPLNNSKTCRAEYERLFSAERATPPVGVQRNPHAATFPAEIWLNVGDGDEHEVGPYQALSELSWCWESIDKFDVRYVRADLAAAAPAPAPFSAEDIEGMIQRRAADLAAAAEKQGQDELHFNAQRLRNVAALVGLESAIPADDETLDGARGAVLGQIASALRKAGEKQAAVPAGWKLVPVEPTEEMLGEIIGHCVDEKLLKNRYRAMLAAAPAAPVAEPAPAVINVRFSISKAQQAIIRRAADALEGLDYEDTAGDLRAIVDAIDRAAPTGETPEAGEQAITYPTQECTAEVVLDRAVQAAASVTDAGCPKIVGYLALKVRPYAHAGLPEDWTFMSVEDAESEMENVRRGRHGVDTFKFRPLIDAPATPAQATPKRSLVGDINMVMGNREAFAQAMPEGGQDRPPAGTVCMISGPNCDDETGYTYSEMEILWADETFVLYGKKGCWPVLNKWDHILLKPLEPT